jgi:putative intracellular protease/amidase
VQSLSLETKSYCTTFVGPELLHSWQRFAGSDFGYQREERFAYKEGKRYLRTLRSTDAAHDRLFNDENTCDGKKVWERRVDLEIGPAQFFVLAVEPGVTWIPNPEYCLNVRWDCKTESYSKDPAALQEYRSRDFLCLLKKGAYTADAGTAELHGARCVVLRRNYESPYVTGDGTNKPRLVQAAEAVWLDADHGFAVRQWELQSTAWGFDRIVNADFVEIASGIWFPKKMEHQAYAPADAPQEYQGRPVLSWNCDLVRWSVNDVPDERFHIVPRPSDLLIVNGDPIKVIDDANQPIDPASEAGQAIAARAKGKTKQKVAEEALSAEEERFVDRLAKAASAPNSETARLRVAIAEGSDCDPPGGLIRLLKTQARCKWEAVSLSDMAAGSLKSFDVLVVPGGQSSRQGEQLGESGRSAIREFVEAGGGYVGICAGASLATTTFDWSLGLVNAKTLSGKRPSPGPDGVMQVDMGKRGSGIVDMELTSAGRTILAGKTRLMDAAFYASPVLLPGERAEAGLPKCVPLAHYRADLWLHKLHMGTMRDTPSILATRFGTGRVIIFSMHPEARPATEPLFVRAVLATAAKPVLPH